MTAVMLTFSFSVVVIVIAGAILTWCADSLGEHTGLGKVFVGGVCLAGATSLPELMTARGACPTILCDWYAGKYPTPSSPRPIRPPH